MKYSLVVLSFLLSVSLQGILHSSVNALLPFPSSSTRNGPYSKYLFTEKKEFATLCPSTDINSSMSS